MLQMHTYVKVSAGGRCNKAIFVHVQVPPALAFRSATHNTIFFLNLGITTV